MFSDCPTTRSASAINEHTEQGMLEYNTFGKYVHSKLKYTLAVLLHLLFIQFAL
jgi:hypothetical protein